MWDQPTKNQFPGIQVTYELALNFALFFVLLLASDIFIYVKFTSFTLHLSPKTAYIIHFFSKYSHNNLMR